MPVVGEWSNPADRRCYGKWAYRKMTVGEKMAQQDSARTGELIIAYQCYDCLRFHVGHADQSQQIVRHQAERSDFSLPAACPNCEGPIPEERRIAAWESGNPTVYCSKRCQKKCGKKALRTRRAGQVEEYAAWFDRSEGKQL